MKRFWYLLHSPLVHRLVLVAAAFAIFSNNYRHEYHLDDGHLLLENTAIRSLKNIPSYFVDPSTLTALRSNIDYRPVLQITYALNYALSGYDTWSWHLVQILLHLLCALGLYAFCLRLMRQTGEDERVARWTSFAVACIFTVHPTASGVVNYLSARSSLLTATLLLPAMVTYMKSFDHPRYRAPALVSAFFFCAALFTKVEAIGALPVFFFYDVWQSARKRIAAGLPSSPLQDLIHALNRTTLLRILPIVTITAIYCAVRITVMANYDTGARHDASVTPLIYFCTQLTAWWYYVLHWVAPVSLVADNMTYPVFRSWVDPCVLLAAGGWLLVAAIVRMSYASHPHLFFLTLSALSLIAPTSSFAPLAEMVNEHRPYLPIAILSCAWCIPLIPRLFHAAGKNRIALLLTASAALVIMSALFTLTWQRNLVFKTARSYNEDILNKAPSARAYANYGLTFLKEGRYAEALANYQEALRLAPNWYIVHINLGLIYQAQGNDSMAAYHFDRAVATDTYSATARIYRGDFLITRKRYADALQDFEAVLPLHRQTYAINKGAATAAAGTGDGEKAAAHARKCYAENPAQCELDVVAMSRPFWDRADLCRAGLRFYATIDSLLPGRWWVRYNIGDLALRCGDTATAIREKELARALKESSQSKIRP